MATRVFLDACVLYPPLVRRLLVDAAGAGLFLPLWSARVLEEWRLAVARKEGLEAEAAVEAARATMALAHPRAECPPAPGVEAALFLPDPADAHVLAAAAGGGAEVLLTFNLRDFPRRTLAAHGIEARHPDSFLWELASHAPEAVEAAIAAALPGEDAAGRRRALKRARLPRLGKALEARALGPGRPAL